MEQTTISKLEKSQSGVENLVDVYFGLPKWSIPSCNNDLGGDCYGETTPSRGPNNLLEGPTQKVKCTYCKHLFCIACFKLRCPRCAYYLFEGLNLEHNLPIDRSWLHKIYGASDSTYVFKHVLTKNNFPK